MVEMYRVGVPTSDMDPFTREAIQNIHRTDGALRESAPALWLAKHDFIAVARHSAAKSILSDWRTFSSKGRPFLDEHTAVPQILVTDDPPEHGKVRSALMQFFAPAELAKMRVAFDIAADEIVDRALSTSGEIDVIGDLARPFILKAFPDMLGLPEEGRELLLLFGEAAFNGAGPRNEILFDSLARAKEGFEWIGANCSRDVVTPDGLAARVYALADEGEVTEVEAALLVQTMLAAGFDTTIAGIGNTLKALIDHPEQWALVHQTPALAKAAFEETLRFDPPARMQGRMAVCEAEVDGIVFQPGDRIGIFLSGAGRDGRRWENPDQFDIGRKGPHLGFGAGIHICLGQALARLETEALLTALARRVTRVESAGDATRLINNAILAWTQVPARLTAV